MHCRGVRCRSPTSFVATRTMSRGRTLILRCSRSAAPQTRRFSMTSRACARACKVSSRCSPSRRKRTATKQRCCWRSHEDGTLVTDVLGLASVSVLVRRTTRSSGPRFALLTLAAERERSPQHGQRRPKIETKRFGGNMTGPRVWFVTTVAVLFIGLMAATPMSLAQVPPTVAFIAILEPGSASGPAPGLGRMKEGLAELGWVEGRTARFETRYADWQPERMIEQARELVLLKPDVLYTHSTPAVLAAMQSTKSIPIVVGTAAELIGMGALKSLAKPGGNITGMSGAMFELDRKRLEVLKETVPSASRVADLVVTGLYPEPVLRKLDDTA